MSPSEQAKFLPLFRRDRDTAIDIDAEREARRAELMDAVFQLIRSVDNLARTLRRDHDDFVPL